MKSLEKENNKSFDGSSNDISSSRNSLTGTPPPSVCSNGITTGRDSVFTDNGGSGTAGDRDAANVARLKEMLAALTTENENLLAENKELKTNKQINESRIQVLQHQLNSVREQSVFFMVEQMERLNTCKETDV